MRCWRLFHQQKRLPNCYVDRHPCLKYSIDLCGNRQTCLTLNFWTKFARPCISLRCSDVSSRPTQVPAKALVGQGQQREEDLAGRQVLPDRVAGLEGQQVSGVDTSGLGRSPPATPQAAQGPRAKPPSKVIPGLKPPAGRSRFQRMPAYFSVSRYATTASTSCGDS